MLPKHNSQISRETLIELGFDKLVQEFDDHEASREGLGFRLLEPKVISKHFEDLGLDPEIANHNEISGLSGGQKVKVVLAGALWNNPHLLVLDEPTNFLDRDSLGGLAVAIRDYRGGVVMISHNEEFVGALCPEQWHVADGRLTQKGHLAVSLDRFEDSRPGSSNASSAVSSATASAVNSGAEDGGDMKFKAKKKKKLTRQQVKEREVRRRLRHIEYVCWNCFSSSSVLMSLQVVELTKGYAAPTRFGRRRLGLGLLWMSYGTIFGIVASRGHGDILLDFRGTAYRRGFFCLDAR